MTQIALIGNWGHLKSLRQGVAIFFHPPHLRGTINGFLGLVFIMLRYLIHDSRYKDVWDAWIMFLAIIAGIEIPLRLVLHYPKQRFLFGMDITLTLFFSLDLMLNLIPVMPNEEDELVPEDARRPTFNIKYLRSWFIVDFMAAFPFGLFLTGVPFDTTHGIKALRLLRLTRLLKLAKMVPLIRKWGNLMSLNPSVLRMLLFFLFGQFRRAMACVWIALFGDGHQ